MKSVLKNLKNLIPQDSPFRNALLPGCGFGFVSEEFSGMPLSDQLHLSEEHTEDKGQSRKYRIRCFSANKLIEFEVVYEYFFKTGVLEISGKARNISTVTLHHVKGPFSLALELDLTQTGPVRMSTLHGGSDSSSCYPPLAYRINRTDGVHHVWGGIHGGRSSETDAPYALLSSSEKNCGLFYALEWPCRWIFSCSEVRKNNLPVLSLLAHAAETDLNLLPGEELILPKVILGFYNGTESDGLNLLRKHVIQYVRRISPKPEENLPVFYNSWMGHGSRFTEEDLKQQAAVYAELGCEYFVVDAGWFDGGFRSGIGNWEKTDRTKFPQGLKSFSEYVRSLGMKFGTWLEPEFAMQNSDWVQRHPDWFYAAPGRHDFINHKSSYEERLLKLDCPAVRRQVLNFLENFIQANHVEWLRWDCNNSPAQFWDANEPQEEWGKIQLAYGNGLFQLWDEFRAACPQVHLETCAGGGFRMDLGTLRRAHSCWMSDNAAGYHSVRRCQISMNQFLGPCYSNSVFLWGKDRLQDTAQYDSFPLEALRSKMAGPLGFSEPCHFYTSQSKEILKKEIALFKKYRYLLTGDFHPLFAPRSLSDYDGWLVHHPETDEGMFMIFRCNSPLPQVSIDLQYLMNGNHYTAENLDTGEKHLLAPDSPFKISIPSIGGTVWFHYSKSPML